MSSIDFFAAREDQIELLRFLFAETDLEFFELASEPGKPLRRFASVEDLVAAFPIGSDPRGTGLAVTLLLRSPSVMPRFVIRRVELDPRRFKGATFREQPDGGALVQLYLGGLHDRAITKSHFGHNSRERAIKWGVAEDVDWEALARLSRRIQYHIRRQAVDKVPGRPILPQAAQLWHEGFVLKEFSSHPHHWSREGLRPDA